jgi:hypothetical protein
MACAAATGSEYAPQPRRPHHLGESARGGESIRDGGGKLAQGRGDDQRNREPGSREADQRDQAVVVVLPRQGVDHRQLDIVAVLPIHRTVGLQIGFARLVFAAQAESKVSFGYAMLNLKY